MHKKFEVTRAERLIKSIVAKLHLDLAGVKVLTEAGSNYFIYTPLIAYYAGAPKVFVWIRDTAYGKAVDIRKDFDEIVSQLGLDTGVFEFGLNERPEGHIRDAHVVTNLGFVRPLNRALIAQMPPDGVISYMCEAWEIRPADVDLAFCKERNIPVAGVWENHPDLLIFNGCGPLAVKLCFEAGFEVYQNNILVLSSDKFGKVAAAAFASAGAKNVVQVEPGNIETVNLADFDFVFVADYSVDGELIGRHLQTKAPELKDSAIVHLCGAVDTEWLDEEGIYYYPRQKGHAFRMTKTLAHLGLKPVIELHAAGLKVGENLYKREEGALVQPL